MTMPHATDRRHFLGGAVAAASTLTSAFGATQAQQAKDKRSFALRYILASSMYGKTPLAEILPEVKKSGAAEIDIWPRGHADQREQIEKMGHERFRALLKQHDVKLGLITRYDLGPYRLQPEIRVARKFGGRLIICGAKNARGGSLKARVKAFVESMKPHLAVAEAHQVTIGIENHSGSLLSSPDSIRYFADFAKSPRLGVALAPYHLPQKEELLASLIRHLGPNLVHFYAWQHGMGCHKKLPKAQEMLQMPGRGTLDFAPLLAALKEIGYRGWTEVFMHPVPRGIPILPTTEAVTAAINESRAYLKKRLAHA